jgi:hypothetical protein
MNKFLFDARPKNSWVLYFPDRKKRLLGRGNPYTDKHFTQFLNSLEDGKVSEILRRFINEYDIHGKPVLMDANDTGFKLVKGDVAYKTEFIGLSLQKLVDFYCHK